MNAFGFFLEGAPVSVVHRDLCIVFMKVTPRDTCEQAHSFLNTFAAKLQCGCLALRAPLMAPLQGVSPTRAGWRDGPWQLGARRSRLRSAHP